MAGLSGAARYAVIFTLVFVESSIIVIGFRPPGDTVLSAAGLLVADQAAGVSLGVLASGVSLVAMAGAVTGYVTGHQLGRPCPERCHGPILARTDAFYLRFGTPVLPVARFVP